MDDFLTAIPTKSKNEINRRMWEEINTRYKNLGDWAQNVVLRARKRSISAEELEYQVHELVTVRRQTNEEFDLWNASYTAVRNIEKELCETISLRM
jgi:hypothetical protein